MLTRPSRLRYDSLAHPRKNSTVVAVSTLGNRCRAERVQSCGLHQRGGRQSEQNRLADRSRAAVSSWTIDLYCLLGGQDVYVVDGDHTPCCKHPLGHSHRTPPL